MGDAFAIAITSPAATATVRIGIARTLTTVLPCAAVFMVSKALAEQELAAEDALVLVEAKRTAIGTARLPGRFVNLHEEVQSLDRTVRALCALTDRQQRTLDQQQRALDQACAMIQQLTTTPAPSPGPPHHTTGS